MNLIFSADEGGAIGRGNELIYHIPEDMARFRSLTMGRTVIMGRQTYLSLPEASRPLPGRHSIILSRDAVFFPEGVTICRSLPELFRIPDINDAFVLGGAQIFRLLEPYCGTAYLTLISGRSEGDTYFTLSPEWKICELSGTHIYSGIKYRFAEARKSAQPPVTDS